MNLVRKSLCAALVAVCLVVLAGVHSSYAWRTFVKTNQLFAVGQFGSEWSYLYEINPLSGELRLIGDTGLNNCTGLDFTPEGKLKTFCELREDGELDNRNGVMATPGVTAELDPDDGFPEWAVPHGISNIISDISINDSGELFSYEDIEVERVHKHLEENDFMADLVGETGIKAEDHAIAFWADGKLKMAANTGTPAWYSIDTNSGAASQIAELSFPSLEVLTTSSSQTRIIEPSDIHFGSMDSVEFDERAVLSEFNTRAGIYAFNETDAEFVVLMYPEVNGIDAAVSTRLIGGPVVGLIDAETTQVDFIVDIQGGVDVTAIAVRKIEPRPIPTMSEWSMIVTSAVLLLCAAYFISRRKITKKA